MSAPEEWRDVVGYEGFYQVSDHGRVFSIKRNGTLGGILAFFVDRNGYLMAHLSAYNKARKKRVHQLVLAAFVGPCPDGKDQVNHKNGIKSDNRPSNLQWCNGSENIKHSYGIGLRSQSCEKNNASKINGYIARAVYIATGRQDDIAKKYGISQSDVSAIKLGRIWVASTGAMPAPFYIKRVGEEANNAKLTEKQAIEIFHAKGKYREIGAIYGVTPENVYRIKNGLSWKYLNLLSA